MMTKHTQAYLDAMEAGKGQEYPLTMGRFMSRFTVDNGWKAEYEKEHVAPKWETSHRIK